MYWVRGFTRQFQRAFSLGVMSWLGYCASRGQATLRTRLLFNIFGIKMLMPVLVQGNIILNGKPNQFNLH
jgi:hypothetical protein